MPTPAPKFPLRKQFATATPLPSTAALPGDDRAVLARISTSAVDRDGEVLLSQGCDASDFLKSPTVFFNHDYDLPVGRCSAINRFPDRVEATTIFASRPPDYVGPWFPDTLLALFQQGVINGFSVGFAPIESRNPTRLDLQTYGPQVRYVYSKWKLFEYSVAPLPANQDALALAVSKGIPPEIIKRLFPTLPTLPGSAVEPPDCPPRLKLEIRNQKLEIPPPPPRRLLILLAPQPRRPQRTLSQHITRALRKAQGRLYE